MRNKLVLTLSIIGFCIIVTLTKQNFKQYPVSSLISDSTNISFHGYEKIYGNERESMNATYLESSDITDLESLMFKTESILKVKPIGRMQDSQLFKTEVVIVEVLKGNQLQKSDTICVFEPVRYVSENEIISTANYIPMQDNQEYIIFVNPVNIYSNKFYNFTDALFSKYPTHIELKTLDIYDNESLALKEKLNIINEYDIINMNWTNPKDFYPDNDSYSEAFTSSLVAFQRDYKKTYVKIFDEIKVWQHEQ